MRLVRAVTNVSMAMGIDALSEFVKKEHKFDLKDLEPGQMMVFINRSHDKMKAITRVPFTEGTRPVFAVHYIKLPQGKLSLGAIQYIPQSLSSSGHVSYDRALRTHLTNSLPNRPLTKVTKTLTMSK